MIPLAPLLAPIVPTHKRAGSSLEHLRPVKYQKTEKAKLALVYCGSGTYEQSTEAIVSQLKGSLPAYLRIKVVNSEYLLSKAWEPKTELLVMGGGMCGEWERELQTEGMHKIRFFVLNGGKYFGICAGAYFGAAQSTFSLIGQPPIEKMRPLQFYQGRAIGTLFPTDNHLSPQAAAAIGVDLASKSGLCYYQGGCYFDIQEDSLDTKIIAKYSFPYAGAAAISCRVGLGVAVLCGPHPEFSWTPQPTSHPQFEKLMHQLVPQEEFRKSLWKSMIKELL